MFPILLLMASLSAELRDDFSVAGTPAHDNWRAEGGSWQVGDGRLYARRADRSWLIWRGIIPPVRLRAEVDVTPTAGSRPGMWGAAGLAVYLDNANYWRLALVENAHDKTNRYFELVEMWQATWQAQAAGSTALQVIEDLGNTAWQFNHTYRFVLEIDGEHCAGTILENGRVVWRRVYALPAGAFAVRRGWPALTVVDMDAYFDNLQAQVEELAIGQREGKLRALVMHNDLPGAAPEIQQWAMQSLERAGFQVNTVRAQDMTSRPLTGADCDVMVLPSAQVVPVGLGAVLDGYLAHGGNLMVIATGPAFQKQLVNLDGEWITPEQAQARVPTTARLLEITQDLPSRLTYASNDTNSPTSVTVEEAPAHIGGHVLHVKVPHFSGWNTWAASLPLGSLTVEAPVLLFWAKGDRATTHMVVEVNEDDRSRWIATVPLTEDWQRLSVRPEDFKYWPDSPAGVQRGFPGDALRPERVVEVRVGLAMSHSPLAGGPKEFWISSLDAGPKLDAASPEKIQVPHLDAISPWYQTFDYPAVSELRTPEETVWPQVECRGSFRIRCAHARPWARVMTGLRGRRWVPVLEARDAEGYHAYAAALMVCSDGPFAGASWSWWGIGPEIVKQAGEKLAPVFAAVAQAHVRRLWMVEAGPDQVAYLPQQQPKWGARVVNLSSQPLEAELLLAATHDGKRAGRMVHRVQVGPMSEKQVSQRWQPGGPGLYQVQAELHVGGKTVDRIVTPVRVISPQPAQEAIEKFVRREGGMFVRGGRWVQDKSGRVLVGGEPWFAHGVNFWPRYVAGLAPYDYGLGWLHSAHYDPVFVEEDLNIAEGLGITALSVQSPRPNDLPCLWDFLERCAAHGIYVNLYIHADPRGFDPELVRDIIQGGRLKDFWSLYAYDITWEPRWGHYEERTRYDRQWEQWVVAQYGSVEAAERVWGITAPRNDQGHLTGPTDDQLVQDGDWRVMVAAYRRFVDDFLSAGYGRSCRFIRALDPRHLISNRAGWGGTGNIHTIRSFQFDPLSGAAHLDFISPEGYGMQPTEGDYRRWGFVDAYCRWAGNGKPTFWSEFGNTIYPGYTPEDYERQRRIWENCLHLVEFAGANGDAGWWWPGGYRVDERSDFGCVEPWGKPRPSALELKKWAPRICGRGINNLPLKTILIDRDTDVRGLAGLWERHLEEYLAAADGKTRVRLATAGDDRTSVDVKIVGVGNVPYQGVGPVKHLNSEFTSVAVQVDENKYLPQDDFLWGEVIIEVPAGKTALVELGLLNTGVATWACSQTARGKPGAVRLLDQRTGNVLAELAHDVPRYAEARLRFSVNATPPAGQENALSLCLEAAGRCRFGQRLVLRLQGR